MERQDGLYGQNFMQISGQYATPHGTKACFPASLRALSRRPPAGAFTVSPGKAATEREDRRQSHTPGRGGGAPDMATARELAMSGMV